MNEVLAQTETGRELGSWDSGRPGPTLLVTGGVHGNEPAGVHALRRVLAALGDVGPRSCGRFVALAGNLPALAAGRRFLSRDLNRGWGAASIAALEGRPAVVTEQVDAHDGRVKIGGDVWSARTMDPTQVLEPGTHVTVVEIDGATAVVWRA